MSCALPIAFATADTEVPHDFDPPSPIQHARMAVWGAASLGCELAVVKVEWAGSSLVVVPAACRLFGLPGDTVDDLRKFWDLFQDFSDRVEPIPLWFRRSQLSGPQSASANAVRFETMVVLATLACTSVHTQKIAGWCRGNAHLVPPPQAELRRTARILQTRALEVAAFGAYARIRDPKNLPECSQVNDCEIQEPLIEGVDPANKTTDHSSTKAIKDRASHPATSAEQDQSVCVPITLATSLGVLRIPAGRSLSGIPYRRAKKGTRA